jgi:hypothetical protein
MRAKAAEDPGGPEIGLRASVEKTVPCEWTIAALDPRLHLPPGCRYIAHFTRRHFIHVAPDPALSRLDGTNQRVGRFLEMLRSMLVLGRIAASHMAANQAKPEMHPSVARLHALFTHAFVGALYFDLI